MPRIFFWGECNPNISLQKTRSIFVRGRLGLKSGRSHSQHPKTALIIIITTIAGSVMPSLPLCDTIISLVFNEFKRSLFCWAHIEILCISSSAVWMFSDPMSRYASSAYFTCMCMRCFGCNVEAQVMKEGGPTTDCESGAHIMAVDNNTNQRVLTFNDGDLMWAHFFEILF